MPDVAPVRTSTDRTFELLAAFAELGPGAHRLHELAERTGLRLPTVHRILQSGIRSGLVAKAGRGRYLLGGPNGLFEPRPAEQPAGEQPCEHRQPPLSGRARRTLAALRESSGQTVLLHIPVFFEAPARYCVAYLPAEPDHFLADAHRQQVSDLVFHSALHEDLAGLVILAQHQPAGHRDHRLREIARAGYGIGPAAVAGWHTVAAPVTGRTAGSGVVALVAPPDWLDRRRKFAIDGVCAAAAALGRQLATPPVRQLSS